MALALTATCCKDQRAPRMGPSKESSTMKLWTIRRPPGRNLENALSYSIGTAVCGTDSETYEIKTASCSSPSSAGHSSRQDPRMYLTRPDTWSSSPATKSHQYCKPQGTREYVHSSLDSSGKS